MKKNISYIVLFGFLILVSSCYYDSDEELYGTSVCNLENVTYRLSVTPIISSHCYACHSLMTATANGAGIILEGYDKLNKMVKNGLLVESIIHGPNASSMPKNAPKISDCNINTIIKWIENGAQDN